MPSNETPVTEELNQSSIEKLLSEESETETLELKEEEETPSEKPSEDEVEEEIKLELEDLEEETPEPKDEDIVNFPRRKEILKKYPNVFKDFPALESAYYKVSKVNEIFSSLDEAKIAASKAQVLDNFERDIFSGNIKDLLKEVKNGNENSFNKIVDNLFTTIHEINPEAFNTLQRDVIGRLIYGMQEEAKETENEAIKNAADIIKQLIFGNGKIETKKLAQEEKIDPEKQKFEQERQQYHQQKFQETAADLAQNIQGILLNTIEKNIDPNDSMSSYVKKNATKDALNYLEEAMRNDASFKAIITRCWDNVFKSNYSRESLEKLKNVYKSRASTLMPTAIKKARSEALKDKKVNASGEKQSNKITSGRVAPVKNDVNPQSKGKRMSTVDYFLKD